jgi:hypothetical protein
VHCEWAWLNVSEADTHLLWKPESGALSMTMMRCQWGRYTLPVKPELQAPCQWLWWEVSEVDTHTLWCQSHRHIVSGHNETSGRQYTQAVSSESQVHCQWAWWDVSEMDTHSLWGQSDKNIVSDHDEMLAKLIHTPYEPRSTGILSVTTMWCQCCRYTQAMSPDPQVYCQWPW